MRRRPAALTVLAVTLLLMLGAGRAIAGGPTSVLLVAPGSGQTASLYSGDDDYQLLAELLGAFVGDVAAEGGRSGTDHAAGNGVTVTWLLHDVQVWRVDWVYPDAPGGPWVATRVSDLAGGTTWDGEVVWHRVVDGALLENLLGRLGLAPGSSRSTVSDVAPAPPGLNPTAAGTNPTAAGSNPTAEDARTPARAAPGPSSRAAAWVWGIAGIVLGTSTGVLVGRRRLPVLRRPKPWPDVATGSPAVPGPDPEEWIPDDELASPGGRRGAG